MRLTTCSFHKKNHKLKHPLVALKPRKFALAFTLGSVLFMLGFAILHGPWNRMSHVGLLFSREARWTELYQGRTGLMVDILTDAKHVFSPERLPFSLAYFGSLGLTLFFAVGVSQ